MLRKLFFLGSFFIALSLQSQTHLKIGSSIPDFKLWMVNGTRITQDSIKNKVVVFKFWFTTCMPCIVDIPKLNSLVEELKNRKDILFIAPALDRKPIIKNFVKYQPFLFDIAYSAMDVSTLFNKIQVYPSYFVYNKKGTLVYIDNASKISEFTPLRKAVLKALKE